MMLTVVVFVLLALTLTLARRRELLERWARENEFIVLEQRQAWFDTGPFPFAGSRNQAVYRIVVRDRAGRTRRVWVRCDFWFDAAEVRWDK